MRKLMSRFGSIPGQLGRGTHDMTRDRRGVVITFFLVVLVMGLAFAGSWLSDRAAGGPAARTNINRTNALIEFQAANQGRTLCVSDISREKDAAVIDNQIAANRLTVAFATGFTSDYTPFVMAVQSAQRRLLAVKASLALQPIICPAAPPPTTTEPNQALIHAPFSG